MYRNNTISKCQWFMPVILATQEAEKRRIMVQSQPRLIVHDTLSQTLHKKGLVEWLVICPEFKPQYCKKKKKKENTRNQPLCTVNICQ
jgi:hypothetical protein